MKCTVIILIVLLFCCWAFGQQKSDNEDAALLEYYQNQRYQEATVFLKNAHPEPVTDLSILEKIAYSSQMAGMLVDAESYYQRIYDRDSTNMTVWFHLGAINLRRGNNLKAAIYFKKIIEKDTTNFIVYKQLAKISFEQRQPAEMTTYLFKANKLNPAEPDAASDLSDALVNFKKFDIAQNVLNKAINADPENAVLLLSLLKLNASEDNFSELKNTCLKLMALGDHSGYVLTKLGMAYYKLKDYECSAATFADLTDMEQGETSYYIAGLAYQALKDQPKAIECFGKAIAIGISPNIASYYGEIADSEEKLSRFKKASRAYLKALQFGDDPILFYLLANLYDTKLKNKKTALKYYKKYLASKPKGKRRTYVAYAESRIKLLAP